MNDWEHFNTRYCLVCGGVRPGIMLIGMERPCICWKGFSFRTADSTSTKIRPEVATSIEKTIAECSDALREDWDPNHDWSRYKTLHRSIDELIQYALVAGVADDDLKQRIVSVLNAWMEYDEGGAA